MGGLFVQVCDRPGVHLLPPEAQQGVDYMRGLLPLFVAAVRAAPDPERMLAYLRAWGQALEEYAAQHWRGGWFTAVGAILGGCPSCCCCCCCLGASCRCLLLAFARNILIARPHPVPARRTPPRRPWPRCLTGLRGIMASSWS